MTPVDNTDLDRADRLDKWRLLTLVLAVLLVAAIVWALFSSARSQANNAATSKAQTFSLAQLVDNACASKVVAADMAPLCAKANTITKAGPAPAAQPPGDKPAQGATGPGPTRAQVVAGVADYLALHPAPAGKNGPGPSLAQITSAVTVYLTNHPPTPGVNGQPGADSVVPGANGLNGTNGLDSTIPGPPPTDAQVAASVAAFCAANADCRGPVGATGTAGADSTVPGPVGPAGEPPLSWVVTDANGRSSTCVRDAPFNPATPTYACTPTP